MDKIIVVDFGSQYTQLIARQVRACKTYCEIIPYHQPIEFDTTIKGVILSGSPASVNQEHAPKIDVKKIAEHVPLLGICYGAQYIVSSHGGKVIYSKREFGKAHLSYKKTPTCTLFENIPQESVVWMSHGDSIKQLPNSFESIASTKDLEVAAFQNLNLYNHSVFGLQFHPEVYHSKYGKQIIHNFLTSICQCTLSWTSSSYIESSINEIRKTVGEHSVLMAISGGVDSTIAAMLIHQAIGKRLKAVFVNNGLLRKNEYDEVITSYKEIGLNIVGLDKSTEFYSALKGINDPEEKRKIIGRLFIKIFEEYAGGIGKIQFLGQGTTYPDVIESVSVHGPSVTIKSHHNVGGLPEKMNLKVIEPIRYLFKDEVRAIGRTLKVPEAVVNRHPFPGPGLAIRIIDDVTPEKVALLQEADYIFIQVLKEYNLYDSVWQAGVILLSVKSVGVMGDERTYEHVVALRAVSSVDGMTADWSKLPHDFLATVSFKIINEVKGINRVVYDISSKPPSTIEWE